MSSRDGVANIITGSTYIQGPSSF